MAGQTYISVILKQEALGSHGGSSNLRGGILARGRTGKKFQSKKDLQTLGTN